MDTARDNSTHTLMLCDFDGTVSVKDTVNNLVRSHVSSPEWRYHVKRYLRGEIGSYGVYQAVAPLMRMTRADLAAFVKEHAELDPAFPKFLQWAESRGIHVKIVSDGFDATIETLFREHGITGLEIFANHLEMDERGGVTITSPHTAPQCGKCGTCKLEILRGFRSAYDRIILVGDGTSDRHAATEADLVLALKHLFVYCAQENLPAVRVQGFHEIPWLMEREIKAIAFDMDGTLIESLDTITDSFNHMFRTLGYPTMTREEVIRKTSISLLDFVRSYLEPHHHDEGVRVFREYYDTIYKTRTTVIPNALETLQALDGTVAQGVVTNKRGQYARLIAEHFGFADRMARIIGAEDGFKAKPSGEMFHEFMRHVGSAQETTIYVGDSPLDVDAARNAGIDSFAVAGPMYTAEELALQGPRRVLHDIGDLPAALRRLL
ncbi:MAG: HAD family hydrolase [Thermodesulfobacteriota bacterium]